MFIVLGKLSWFFRENWKRYTIALLFLNLCNFTEIAPPYLIGLAIDKMQDGSLTAAGLSGFVALMIGIAVVNYVMMIAWHYNLFGGSNLLEYKLRGRFMAQLLRMTPVFYQRNRTGDLMARATNDLRAISATAGFGILTLVDSSLFMAVVLCMMGFSISWKLTLAALLPMPLLALLINRYGKLIHQRFTDAQDAFGNMNDTVLESVSGARVVRAYVQEERDRERFHEMSEGVYRKNMAVARIDSLFEPTVKLIVSLSYIIGLCYGAYMVYHSELSLGQLVSFNIYLGMMIWPMFAIGELINVMQRGNASLDRVEEILSYEPEVEAGVEKPEVQVPSVIRFNNYSFRYPEAPVQALQDISFELHKGQTLGIVGRTGSGKTTLLKQLLREYPIGEEGSVTVSGIPIEEYAAGQVRGWSGYVPQEPTLFSMTVRENVLFGAPRESDSEALLNAAIRMADFTKDIEFLPEGLETIVGEKGVSLSGGQKQRISIARAFLSSPEILMLDDSMSAVDGKTEAAIIRNIRAEREGKTTIITTHRLSAIQHADLILVLDDGRIVQRGTHEELVSVPGWYQEQYARQQAEEGE